MKKIFIASVIAVMFMSLTTYAENEIEATSNADTHMVTVSGNMEAASKRVMIAVLSSGAAVSDIDSLTADNIKQHILGLYMAYTDETGYYEVSFKLKKEAGEYTVVAFGPVNGERYSTVVFNPGDMTDVLNQLEAARTADDASKIKELLETGDNFRSLGMGKPDDEIYGVKFQSLEQSDFNFLAVYNEPYTTAEMFLKAYYEMCVVKAFNSLQSEDGVQPLIENCDDVLSVKTLNAYKIYLDLTDKAPVNKAMLEGGFDSAESIVERFCEKTYLQAVKTMQNWSEFKSFLAENNDYFGLDLSEYKNLKNPSEVDKALAGKSFSSVESFKKSFTDAVKNEKKEETTDKTSGSTGGGNSSGGSKISSYTAPVVTPKPPKTFRDLDTVPWAKEAIFALLGQNIIAGKEEGLFYPNDILTREEIAKILVEAFKAEKENVSCDFTDIKSNHWSYKYVAAAKKADIINGYEDGTFGIGKGLKRQELAAMIYRAAKANGIEFKNVKEIEFADEEKIASYAKEAVGTLGGAGIINGKGENLFAPDDYCTRAEAAKIIYAVLNVEQEEE